MGIKENFFVNVDLNIREFVRKLCVFNITMAISSCDLFMINVQLFKETKYTLRPLIDMQAFLEIVSIFF